MACFCRHGLGADEPIPFAEPGIRPHYAPDRVVRIERATVRISLEPEARSFSGEAVFQLAQLPTYQGSFGFDLDDVEVTSVTGEGSPLDYTYSDGELRIRASAAPSEVVIRWTGCDPTRGMYFTGPAPYAPERAPMAWTQCQDEDGHFVFPCHDHPSVKHPWTIELDAPAGYTLLSNGRMISHLEVGDRVRATYEQAEPMPAYLVTFVAARLAVQASSWEGRAVRFLVPEGEERNVERAFGRTVAMIDHFSRRFGVPYPWPRYDQVVVHEFVMGGMENVACTTMTDNLLVDAKAELEWQPDGLVAHELAHQWFGNLVTCRDWSQGWLNESWATYVEALWWEHSRSAADAIWYRFRTAQGYFSEHHTRYSRPIVSYDFREPIDVFDRHLYNKGSCVLWTLRHQLGDEAFFAGVRRYLERNAHGIVHTRDFQHALEAESGTNLDGFFADWVFRAGHPQLEVTVGREGDAHLAVTVRQKQADRFDLTLRLEVHGDGEPRVIDLRVQEESRTYVIEGGPDAHVRVDPGYRVLAEIELAGPTHWLVALLDDEDPVLVTRAARALLSKDSARGRQAVFEAQAGHAEWSVRASLARRMAKHGSPRTCARLVERLAAETEPRVRRAIVEALGELRTYPEAADALLGLLAESDLPTWHLEASALVALAKTRDARALDVIRSRLSVRGWAHWVQHRAVEALGWLRDPSVVPDLITHSGPDLPGRVRSAAAGALGHLAPHVSEPVRHQIVDRLCELVELPGFRTQITAMSELGSLGETRALPALRKVHQSAPDGRLRRTAFEAMARIRRGADTPDGVKALRGEVERLSEENQRLRDRVDRLER